MENESLRKLFIGGLNRATTDVQLREYFTQFGNVSECVIIKDQDKKSKGFGFVTMVTSHDADLVLLSKAEEESHSITGRTVEVKRAIPRDMEMIPDATTKLFVAGFKNSNITEDDLRAFFEEFIEVEDAVHPVSISDVHIVKDKETKASKGFAFVTLSNRHMVDKCAIVGSHMIGGKKIATNKATPKDSAGGAMRGGSRGGRGGASRGGRDGGYGGGGYGGGDGYGNGYSGGRDRYGGGSYGSYEGYEGGYGGDSSSGYGPVKGGYGGYGGGGYGGGGYGGGGYAGSYDSYGSSRGGGRGGYRPY